MQFSLGTLLLLVTLASVQLALLVSITWLGVPAFFVLIPIARYAKLTRTHSNMIP